MHSVEINRVKKLKIGNDNIMTTTSHIESNKKNFVNVADRTADRVDGVIKSAVDTVRDQSAHYMDEARNLAESGQEAVMDKYKEVEGAVKDQSDLILSYIKENPVKSIAIALGAGYAMSCMMKK